MKARLEAKLDKLELTIKSIQGVLYRVSNNIAAEEFTEARADLSEASNEIDDAMGIIDELTAPEEERDYDVP